MKVTTDSTYDLKSPTWGLITLVVILVTAADEPDPPLPQANFDPNSTFRLHDRVVSM